MKINEAASIEDLNSDEELDGSTNQGAIVAESTASKVRTFLYEIAQGTTNYRSLHSLTQQVEHQYHGRFLVELIQNAHDALFEAVGMDRARIRVIIDDDDGPFGALYIANDGRPISRSNFTSLSQLGQSDKDPQKSIGNKGIGFRSVLEITDSPQVFSRSERESCRFDGLCFGFSPCVLEVLKQPIAELAIKGTSPASPIGSAPLVDWDSRLIEKFKKVTSAKGAEWLAKELTYLSPYLLPVALSTDDAPDQVKTLERDGYATVIRLPLKSEAARSAAKERVAQLPSDTVLFLDRVSTLILDDGGGARRLTRDMTRHPASRFGRHEVVISGDHAAQPESYLIWGRTIRVADAPAQFREALVQLPGKWPELTEARVAIAIRVGAVPASGLFSVFLPTLLKTGSSAHVNAPFFADMSRTHIEFEEQAYNRGLLAEVWSLVVEIARHELAGADATAADALIDLLAPTGVGLTTQRWREGVLAALADAGLNFSEQEWFPTGDGVWSSLSVASLLPIVPNSKVFTEATLREHATFSVFDTQLEARRDQLDVLAGMAGYDVTPSKVGLAKTAEVVAEAAHSEGNVDWNSFWKELHTLLQGDATPLIGHRVLMGVDDQLHATGEDCAVFFIPRHGAGEDDDVVSESAIVDIPARLRPHVAFLHSSITLYDASNLRQQTQTRKFLEKTLVNRFRVEDIFNEVLIKRTPALPAKLKGDESELCADILHWGLGLLSNLAGRGRGDKTIRMLKDLALPCRGGWIRANETSYGSGWPAHLGGTLQRYLLSAKTDDCKQAAKRLLLPARHALWRDFADRHVELLDAAGVATGLRVNRVDPSDWRSTFSGIQGAFDLPTAPPPRYSALVWGSYRSWVRGAHVPYGGSTHNYQMQQAFLVPGLSDFERFDNSTRTLLMQLLLGSMASWPVGWASIECKKMAGNPGPVSLKSPLWFALHQLPWLGVHQRDQLSWRPPSHHWYVPAKLLGTRAWQFEHLHPLPAPIAHLLDQNKDLVSALAGLGTHQYDPEAKSNSTALLDALARAAEASELRDPNIFLGQVRGAWTCFTPGANQVFPKKVIVSRSGRRLQVVIPTRDSPVYLPDSSRSSLAALDQFDIPLVAIDASDAKRVAPAVVAAYGGAVVATSALRVVPIADGIEWTPADLPKFYESKLNWIAPMALTLAAYFGPNQRGTGSQRFAAQLQALREVKLAWCQVLTVALFHGEHKLAQPEAAAVWIPESKTLLLTSACETEPRLLSESLASILERDDLEVALKCVLRDAAGDDRSVILNALADLKLSEGQFLEVQEQWTGNLRYVVDQLMPLLLLLRPRANPRKLLELQTEEQLSASITALGAGEFNGRQLLSLARQFPDTFDFGWQCYQLFGNAVVLPAWNQAIARFGGKPVRNRRAEEEFSSHLARARSMMRSLLAFLAAQRTPTKTFRELLAELDSTSMPPGLAETRWEVRFADVWSAIAPIAVRLADSANPQFPAFAESVEALAAELAEIGVAVDNDPVRLARDNRDRLKQGLARLQQIGLAWALANDRSNTAPWEVSPEILVTSLDDALATDAYLQPWSELDIFMLVTRLPHVVVAAPVAAAVQSATSLSGLQALLGISTDSIAGAALQLRDMKDKARRQRRLVDVCGREFDGDEENLGSLWAHICESLPDASLAGMPLINLGKPLKLGALPPRRGGGGGVPTRTTAPRTTRSNDMLVGMAGEIHAFRRLQHQHGAAVVTSSSWISRISVSAFPENASFADDGAGCDFRFMAADGVTFHVEVKSSAGADESFTLGSSEIRLAMELARATRRRQKDRFVILRVLGATSNQPAFQVLPNPYDGRYTSLFDIVEAGVRVRYRLAAAD